MPARKLTPPQKPPSPEPPRDLIPLNTLPSPSSILPVQSATAPIFSHSAEPSPTPAKKRRDPFEKQSAGGNILPPHIENLTTSPFHTAQSRPHLPISPFRIESSADIFCEKNSRLDVCMLALGELQNQVSDLIARVISLEAMLAAGPAITSAPPTVNTPLATLAPDAAPTACEAAAEVSSRHVVVPAQHSSSLLRAMETMTTEIAAALVEMKLIRQDIFKAR